MALRPTITDPTGEQHNGVPTYRWNDAPSYLMTRRQLAAKGLRKGGQDPVAVMRWYDNGWQVAYLYDSTTARPRRPWTAAKQAAVQKAADAKKTCRGCGSRLDYVPRDYTCEPCHDDPTRGSTTMVTRLNIDYAGGTVQITSGHGNALRDVVRLLTEIVDGRDRSMPLIDDDGTHHDVNPTKLDRVDMSWEPSADQEGGPAAPAV